MTTKEQIIIDGVQFNKWGDFLIDYELNGIYKTISSSDKCYKILKSLIEQLQSKEQECEELKKENQNLKNMYNSMSDLCEIKDEAILDKNADIEELSQHCFEYSDRIHNFKQALDEIEKELKEDINCESQECACDNFEECLKCTKEHILDIIHKAKGEGNE